MSKNKKDDPLYGGGMKIRPATKKEKSAAAKKPKTKRKAKKK